MITTHKIICCSLPLHELIARVERASSPNQDPANFFLQMFMHILTLARDLQIGMHFRPDLLFTNKSLKKIDRVVFLQLYWGNIQQNGHWERKRALRHSVRKTNIKYISLLGIVDMIPKQVIRKNEKDDDEELCSLLVRMYTLQAHMTFGFPAESFWLQKKTQHYSNYVPGLSIFFFFFFFVVLLTLLGQDPARIIYSKKKMCAGLDQMTGGVQFAS